MLLGSRSPQGQFQTPLYKRPPELVNVVADTQRGLLKPVIDVVMPLEKCADAHRRLEHREQFGKIVLSV